MLAHLKTAILVNWVIPKLGSWTSEKNHNESSGTQQPPLLCLSPPPPGLLRWVACTLCNQTKICIDNTLLVLKWIRIGIGMQIYEHQYKQSQKIENVSRPKCHKGGVKRSGHFSWLLPLSRSVRCSGFSTSAHKRREGRWIIQQGWCSSWWSGCSLYSIHYWSYFHKWPWVTQQDCSTSWWSVCFNILWIIFS